MFKALRLGRGKAEPHAPSTTEERAQVVQESIELERALSAMDTVLDGQIDQATRLTSVDDKLFTKVATGVLRFIEATVSFEPEAILAAVDALSASEQSATKNKSTAQASGLQTSSYRPGAEFELAEQESSLLGAISMLLTESKYDILKALLKIRKTYLALEELRKHVETVNAERGYSITSRGGAAGPPSKASTPLGAAGPTSTTSPSTPKAAPGAVPAVPSGTANGALHVPNHVANAPLKTKDYRRPSADTVSALSVPMDHEPAAEHAPSMPPVPPVPAQSLESIKSSPSLKSSQSLQSLQSTQSIVAPSVRSTHSISPHHEFERLHAERTARSRKRFDAAPTTTPRDTIDEYVQSGVEVMSGLLHLILSSVPPSIARLLSVVGLHGEREPALSMLWSAASNFRNIHGSLALIALIMFFDGQLQYQDITLSPEEENQISDRAEKLERSGSASVSSGKTSSAGKTTAKLTPRELRETREKLMTALREQRVYYPHGYLWLLQEGRLVTHQNLVKGVAILESPECGPNQMRQVEGLLVFDRTMFLLSLDRLEEAAKAFIDLMEVSSWSHPLYMYLSAACHLELYRSAEDPKSAVAQHHKKMAEKWFNQAPQATGKKKVLGRKMPFDGFVVRKVEKFRAMSQQRKADLADVIATSPLYEALYFWNGPSRMSPPLAGTVVKRLHYSAASEDRTESMDDAFTRELLEATYARRSLHYGQGYEMVKTLSDRVVSGDVAGLSSKKVTYHALGEPWAGPACLYERAVYEWLEFGKSHAPQVRRWLELSSNWPDDYELSTRVLMKVTGAQDRLDIYRM